MIPLKLKRYLRFGLAGMILILLWFSVGAVDTWDFGRFSGGVPEGLPELEHKNNKPLHIL